MVSRSEPTVASRFPTDSKIVHTIDPQSGKSTDQKTGRSTVRVRNSNKDKEKVPDDHNTSTGNLNYSDNKIIRTSCTKVIIQFIQIIIKPPQ